MVKINFKSWQVGLEKVSLSKLQMSILEIPLKTAKHNVDRLLDGERVIVLARNEEIALHFIEEASKIGAICEIVTVCMVAPTLKDDNNQVSKIRVK
jgi:hypothetical protein